MTAPRARRASPDPGAADAGTADAGTADAGTADAGTADAGTMDAGTMDAGTMEVRVVHPFQARKRYVCPGCQHDVRPGTGHLVVVPAEDPALRRHWHRPCWEQRLRRRPGR